jgi:DNA-binding transcriptional MerR regulator
MPDEPRYAIGDLADLGGVSRRTVRFYVQEGLLPAPYGLGRGNHYGQVHLDQLLRVKALQEAGRTLDEVRDALRQTGRRSARLAADAVPPPRTLWRRVALAPGVELHISSELRLPSEATLHDLANWCRTHLIARKEEDVDG